MLLRFTYLLLLLICIAPTIPGLIGAAITAFGYAPSVGQTQLNFAGFVAVSRWPGVSTSLLHTISTSIFSTYLALLLTFSILQTLWQNKAWQRIEGMLSPLLSMPHVAFAIGFAFLFAPTGFGARLVASLTGVEVDTSGAPIFIKDQWGLGLTLALALKEVPFLLLMSIPILKQLKLDQQLKVSQSLGYSNAQAWWKTIFPQWLSKMRFALFAVIAYGASVVDLALILGPSLPPTFSVLVWQWFADPDLSFLPRNASGALILLLLTSSLLLLVVIIEKAITVWGNSWQFSGRSGSGLPGKTVFLLLSLLAILMVPLFVLWSFAQRWRFPDLLPSQFSTRFWQNEWINVWPTIYQSLTLAITAAAIALILAIFAHEFKIRHAKALPDYVIALPMLIPQLSLLFGIQVTTLWLAADQFMLWVIWSHVFFAFPFVYLALDGPWKSYENHYTKVAMSLGHSPLSVFFTVKAKLLAPALLYGFAIGASVSLAQYLPTLMLGAGRVSTITTEAVAVSSGFDRRVTAIYALWQAALPLVFFAGALLIAKFTSIGRVQRRIQSPNFSKGFNV